MRGGFRAATLQSNGERGQVRPALTTEIAGASPVYSPTTRLLTILELLQARQQRSGADLAARLEIDRRTVRRYITML